MIHLTSAELNTWIAALLWPLTRILGLIAAAPLFGNTSIPVPVKVSLGVLLAAILTPAIPALPAADPMSLAGLLILVQEMLIGLAMGFAMRIVFAAVEMAGEISSLTMGLGFASFFDPETKGRSSAVSQFLALIATMAFLALNAHLALLEALAESFVTLPIVAALLITNVALGILTRAAPQLNIFGIGFPVSLAVGLLTISVALPYLNMPVQNLINQGIEASRKLVRNAAMRTPPAVPVAPAR